jgi:methionyl-tRNA formyltransferase
MTRHSPSLRLVFAGTPEFAAAHLAAVVGSEHELVAVYTQPDRPAGRGRSLQASPVKLLAQEHGLPVRQPASLKEPQVQAELAQLRPDLLVVVAYGLLLPQAVLDIPRYGCINVHASLLPRWRGAAPIQRAIQAGDPATGITIMQMDAGLDTGAMLATRDCPLDDTVTAGELHDRLLALGPPLLLEVLGDIERFRAGAVQQDDAGATYGQKISKEEAEIDWRRDAASLGRDVRAFNPFPVCFSTIDGQRLKIIAARPLPDSPARRAPGTILQADTAGIVVACGSGALVLLRLQLPGGKPLDAGALLNARRDLFAPGTRLGSP